MRYKHDWCGALLRSASAVLLAGFVALIKPDGSLANPQTPEASLANTQTGSYLASYFDVSTGAGDNIVNIVNPTRANGSICALIYLFDNSEELGECCGCPITPDERLTGSVSADFLRNWQVGVGVPKGGVIKILSTLNTGASCPADDPACNVGGGFISSPAIACDPTSESSHTPVQNLSAWITHSTIVGQPPGWACSNSVDEFADEGSADAVEAAFLPNQCEDIIANGSGTGVCSCPTPSRRLAADPPKRKPKK
jgi:hypothetical protein